MISSSYVLAQTLDYGIANESLTRFAGLPCVARLARFLDLGPVLRCRVRVKRRRGCRDDEMLLALVLSLCTGGGPLSTVDTLAAGTAGTGPPGCAPCPVAAASASS